eukprot:1148297-Pelagomonas_calceolata.AAC.6
MSSQNSATPLSKQGHPQGPQGYAVVPQVLPVKVQALLNGPALNQALAGPGRLRVQRLPAGHLKDRDEGLVGHLCKSDSRCMQAALCQSRHLLNALVNENFNGSNPQMPNHIGDGLAYGAEEAVVQVVLEAPLHSAVCWRQKNSSGRGADMNVRVGAAQRSCV